MRYGAKIIALFLAMLPFMGHAQEINGESFDQLFPLAQQAYDESNFSKAALLYETMLSNGCYNAEVFFNLANTYFKNNNLPEAVRRYRQAWYLAPRDPDIKANLGFALNAANAIPPKSSPLSAIAESLSIREWMIIGEFGYAALIVLITLALLIKSTRLLLFKVCTLPLLVVFASGAGMAHWNSYKKSPELIITRSGATALYGPIENSTKHYKVPAAAIVRQIGKEANGWSEIRYDGKKGWLKKAYIIPVYP